MFADPAGGVACDYGALRGAETALASAAADLDGAGALVPAGDHGEAAALVAVLLATLSETAARLVTEGKVLGLGIRVASGEVETTDADQALRFVEVGR